MTLNRERIKTVPQIYTHRNGRDAKELLDKDGAVCVSLVDGLISAIASIGTTSSIDTVSTPMATCFHDRRTFVRP